MTSQKYILTEKEKQAILTQLYGPYLPEWRNNHGVVENTDAQIAKRMGLGTTTVSHFTNIHSQVRMEKFNDIINSN